MEIFEATGRYDYTQRMSKTTKIEDREYLNLYLRADNQNRLYKRQMDDILTYLGDLGGLFDALYVLGYSLTALSAGKLFSAALIS